MNDFSFSGGLLELCLGSEGHQLRVDLEHGVVTMALVAWDTWHLDTRQETVTPNLIHFIEPDGRIVGICTLGGGHGRG